MTDVNSADNRADNSADNSAVSSSPVFERLARLGYSAAWCVLGPFTLLRLWRRAKQEPLYWQRKRERFGFGYPVFDARPGGTLVWLHAVSLGETRAAAPVVDALLAAHPELSVLLTHMTATGREAGQAIAARHAGRVIQAWLPYDFPWAVQRFLKHFSPVFSPLIGVIMETEVWPNLQHAAIARGVPMLLANARMSEKSARSYQRFAWLARPALASFAQVLAQAAPDAQRLSAAGARQVQVLGNIKFDATPDAAQCAAGKAWRAKLNRPVLIAASTREGEEALLLEQIKKCTDAGVLLLLVPRHPQRFESVALLLAAHSIDYKRYSELSNRDAQDTQDNLPKKLQVVLGDTLGQMAFFYSASDLAIMGGSLLPFGCQNLIEACACDCPVVLGPSTFNFAEVARAALELGAATQETDPRAVLPAALQILCAPERLQQARLQARAFAASQRGALERHLAVLLGYV